MHMHEVSGCVPDAARTLRRGGVDSAVLREESTGVRAGRSHAAGVVAGPASGVDLHPVFHLRQTLARFCPTKRTLRDFPSLWKHGKLQLIIQV